VTVDVEQRVRSTLSRWAQDVPDHTGDPHALMSRTAEVDARPSRRGLLAAGLAVAAALLVVVAVAVTRDSDESHPPADVTTEQSLGDPPTVVYRSPDPGWAMTSMALIIDPPSPTYLEYQLVGPDGQELQLSLYPLGSREATAGLPDSATVTVRNRPGTDTTYRDGRYRIDWDEAGKTWEATGQGFDSLEAVVAAVDGFEIVDTASWYAWLPAEVGAFLAANPGRGLTWNSVDGLKPWDVPGCPAPTELDEPLDATGRSLTDQHAPEQLEQLALRLFPGEAVSRSYLISESARCRARGVELRETSAVPPPDGVRASERFVRILVSDTLGMHGSGTDTLRATGEYRWENEGVVGLSVLTKTGREVAVTAGHPTPSTDALLRDPAFADELRTGVEGLGY
jgi:hypothetical protein